MLMLLIESVPSVKKIQLVTNFITCWSALFLSVIGKDISIIAINRPNILKYKNLLLNSDENCLSQVCL